MRPNGHTGWVPRASLGRLHTVRTFLRVDKHRLRATLYRGGRPIWHAPVGIGKHGTETPGGHFYVRERLKVRDPGSLYGPLAFGTSAYSKLSDWPGGGVIGIHGTNEPGLIPGRPSHGCVRLRNRDIVRLGRLMPVGTPVRIG
jgi:lipoprotein-anchoring transpeptidase ErfK/SrfK